MNDHSFLLETCFVTTLFQAFLMMAFKISLPILLIWNVMSRWSSRNPFSLSLNPRSWAHFTRLADGPGILVFGCVFCMCTDRFHKSLAINLQLQIIFKFSWRCWLNMKMWVNYSCGTQIRCTPWIRLVAMTNDCTRCCTSYLSIRSMAVGAASQPWRADGHIPPIITLLYLMPPMAHVLFCLFFNALIKAFWIISQEFHSAVVDVDAEICGIIHDLEFFGLLFQALL